MGGYESTTEYYGLAYSKTRNVFAVGGATYEVSLFKGGPFGLSYVPILTLHDANDMAIIWSQMFGFNSQSFKNIAITPDGSKLAAIASTDYFVICNIQDGGNLIQG